MTSWSWYPRPHAPTARPRYAEGQFAAHLVKVNMVPAQRSPFLSMRSRQQRHDDVVMQPVGKRLTQNVTDVLRRQGLQRPAPLVARDPNQLDYIAAHEIARHPSAHRAVEATVHAPQTACAQHCRNTVQSSATATGMPSTSSRPGSGWSGGTTWARGSRTRNHSCTRCEFGQEPTRQARAPVG